MPLPGDEMPPDRDDSPELGSGFNFLNAPSAAIKSWPNGAPVSYRCSERGYFLINLNFLVVHYSIESCLS